MFQLVRRVSTESAAPSAADVWMAVGVTMWPVIVTALPAGQGSTANRVSWMWRNKIDTERNLTVRLSMQPTLMMYLSILVFLTYDNPSTCTQYIIYSSQLFFWEWMHFSIANISHSMCCACRCRMPRWNVRRQLRAGVRLRTQRVMWPIQREVSVQGRLRRRQMFGR